MYDLVWLLNSVESEIEINQKCSEVQEPDIRFL